MTKRVEKKNDHFFLRANKKLDILLIFDCFSSFYSRICEQKKGKKPVNTSLKNQKTKQGYENTSMYYILMMYIVQVPSFLRCLAFDVRVYLLLVVGGSLIILGRTALVNIISIA